MGDSFQIIVDRDVSADDAARSAIKIVNWLVSRRIVEAVQTDCVLGAGHKGHRPGADYRAAIAPIDPAHDHTLETSTNGLQVVTRRTVFHAGQYGLELVCRECGHRLNGGTAWSAAVSEWYAGGTGRFACPKCGHAESVNEWTYEPPWGFGNLGFEFWNWPPLKPAFVAEVGKRLRHRTVLVCGKV